MKGEQKLNIVKVKSYIVFFDSKSTHIVFLLLIKIHNHKNSFGTNGISVYRPASSSFLSI